MALPWGIYLSVGLTKPTAAILTGFVRTRDFLESKGKSQVRDYYVKLRPLSRNMGSAKGN